MNQEPHAAYLPRVVDLIEHLTGRPVQMWRKEDWKMLCDLFHKGLWDFEAVYMDRYFPREVLLQKNSLWTRQGTWTRIMDPAGGATTADSTRGDSGW